MHRAFIVACANFSSSFPDWNAEFQLAWEMEDNTIAQARARMEALRRIEDEFLSEAVRTVKQIVTLDDNGPRELPRFLHCYRVQNIFFRVLPDSRSGRNYVASLRGVLQSRTRLLTVPLSCMLFYRGMPVLAQALVPMPQQPTRLYGADSTNDREVEAEVLHMAEALNIPFPDHSMCEVYAGLDSRLYCTSTNVTIASVNGSPLMRQEMVFLCGLRTNGSKDAPAVLHAPAFLDELFQLKDIPPESAPAHLCDTLHLYGINLCFLKQVLRSVTAFPRSDAKVVEACVAVEMIARTMKQVFCLRVQSSRVTLNDKTLPNRVFLHVAQSLRGDTFKQDFLPALVRKYKFAAEDMDIVHLLEATLASRRRDIIARFLSHIGARIQTRAASCEKEIVWLPKLQSCVVPLLTDAQVALDLAARHGMTGTREGHMCAFCLPLHVRLAYWKGSLKEALQFARWVAASKKARYGQSSLPYLYAIRDVCKLLFSGNTVKLIREGCTLLESMLEGFHTMAGRLSQMRLHLEGGCWLLGSSEIVDMGEKALQHFQTAVRLAPPELRSNCGAWRYIQPSLGLLRCKQALRLKMSVDMVDVAKDATQLAYMVTPADYYVEYLWELGMELRLDGKYEAASTTLFTAVSLCRKIPHTRMDLSALTCDLINVYRTWNPDTYGMYCDALLTTLKGKHSGRLPSPPKEFAKYNLQTRY